MNNCWVDMIELFSNFGTMYEIIAWISRLVMYNSHICVACITLSSRKVMGIFSVNGLIFYSYILSSKNLQWPLSLYLPLKQPH